jgi:3-methyladenine DNA glycosylase AlkD
MTEFATVMSELEGYASEQTATIYSRRQPTGNVLGVKFGDMGKIIKKARRNTPMAIALWETGTFEARHIACKVIDPADVTESQIDAWVEQIDFPLLSDDLAGVVAQTPFAARKRREWTAREDEFVRRAGYSLLHLAASDPANPVSDEELLGYLRTIEAEIHGSANWAREKMNYAPVAIGRRGEQLFEPALAAARAYGKIDVFHGDKTRCKITDAVAELTHPPQRPMRKQGNTSPK